MSEASRLRALGESGLLHPNPTAVDAPLFAAGGDFFLAADKVQVKYEMLRAHLVDGLAVTEAATAHGYSRAAFYLVSASFERAGDGRAARRAAGAGAGRSSWRQRSWSSSAPTRAGRVRELAEQVADRFGVRLHRRTVERARRPVNARSLLAAGRGGPGRLRDAARRSCSSRQHCPTALAAARFTRRGLAGLIAWPAAEPCSPSRACRRHPAAHGARSSTPGVDGAGSRAISFCWTPPRPRYRTTRPRYRGGSGDESRPLRTGVDRTASRTRHDRLATGGAAGAGARGRRRIDRRVRRRRPLRCPPGPSRA